MDYFTSNPTGGPDSLSLQEMLDIDLKSDNDYDNVFSCGDYNLNFHELPALNLDEDSLGAPGDNNVWLASEGSSLLDGDVSSFSQDLNSGETRMVSPNSVIPVTLIQVPYDRSNGRASEATLLKHTPIKVNGPQLQTVHTPEFKVQPKEEPEIFVSDVEVKEEYESDEEDSFDELYSRPIALKDNHNARNKSRNSNVRVANGNGTKRNGSSLPIKSVHAKKRLQESSGSETDMTSAVYPKPAYSYSCLIAMALKNSPSGSLPVSEIYNFMCDHFPYFKTAPNGWKNSVRHNLSLNKCFEKIEKPATNGSQRKGCLWALNPSKMNKMDEEVQKWSKKDKTAIRRSMLCPDTLDALEKGELSSGNGIGASEADSDDEAWEQDEENVWPATYQAETDDEEEKDWINERVTLTRSDDGSDLSLEDFDIDVSIWHVKIAEKVCREKDIGNLNVRVNVQTATTAFKPLMAASYSVNPQLKADSPKRIKTLGGTTMRGNFVYKPVGRSLGKTKSPHRQPLLSSLEADD